MLALKILGALVVLALILFFVFGDDGSNDSHYY